MTTQTEKSGPASAPLSPLKQAFLALEQAQTRVNELERAWTEPIAIIGAGCRIPGGEDGVEGYWKLLREQKCAVEDRVEERFAEAQQRTRVKTRLPEAARWAALLERIDRFDPQHFGISPREAAGIDPQQRLLLEVSWEALENAGIDPLSTYQSSTGVYMGIASHDYAQLQLAAGGLNAIHPHFSSGIAASVASGRISYVLGLKGPSLSIDTACSSSLVAVHLACEALRREECALALAGGVNLILSPEPSIAFAQAGMLSLRGTCRAFAQGADGFVRGEGCGVVILKKLSEAEASGDRILGLILGSAVNQDGASSGLTVPNGQAQQELLRQAMSNAGVEPWQVGYVEAHGTGTALGDPIEAEALGVVFGSGKKRERPLLIGSVKTNLGHLEAAAGVAGLIKVVLGLQHEAVPGQPHWERPSEHVRWSELPLEVATKCQPWEAIHGRRIGGVSSFGFSGTNAHVVLEAWTGAGQTEEARPAEVLVLTARTTPALRELAERYAQFLEESEAGWREICNTAATGRGVFAERLAIAASNKTEATEKLRAWLRDEGAAPHVSRGRVRMGERVRVGLVFGRNCEKLDSVVGIGFAEDRGHAWQKKLRSWGVEPVVTVPPNKDAARELKAAEATVALVLGDAEVNLDAMRVKNGWRELAGAIAELFVRGAAINWKEWKGGQKLRPVALPTYPFQRERYWIVAEKRNGEQAGEATGRKMLGTRLRAAGVRGQYELELGLAGTETAWIGEHVLGGRAILPATGHLELMLEAGAEIFGPGPLTVEDLVLQVPLVLDRERAVQVAVEPETGERSRVRVYAETERNDWRVISEGWLSKAESSGSECIDVGEIQGQLKERTDLEGFYAAAAESGAEFGEKFRGLRRLWLGKDEALGEVSSTAAEEGYAIAPWRLDACLQIAAGVLTEGGVHGEMYLPLSAGEFTIYGQPGEVCWSHMRMRRIDAGTMSAEVTVSHPDGSLLARFSNLRFRKFTASTVDPASWVYRLNWRPDDLKTVSRETHIASSALPRQVLLLGTPDRLDSVAAHLRRCGAGVVCASMARVDEVLPSSPEFDAVLYFVSSQDMAEGLPLGDATEQVGKPLRGLLAVAQGILGLAAAKKPRLYVITENACAVAGSAHLRLLEAPLAGVANCIALEAPELRCTLIDGPGRESEGIQAEELSAQVADEVLGESEDLRIAFRSGRRHVARLQRLPASELVASEPVRLILGNQGDGTPGIEALTYEPVERRDLQPDEVEIAVRATALNFRDVLKATGVLDHSGSIGTDCAGIVVRRGSAVSEVEVGEEVVAIAPDSFATHAVTSRELVAAKPPQLSFEDAAAQTVAYLTAEYSLNEVVRIGKGQRVLIHAAAGGVGLAAVHLARSRGAEVFATAGSEQKRAYLRSLGIEQVFDSRTLAFQDQIAGGVDIVLNSLAGAAVDAGLRLLRPGGVFIELGKTDIRGTDFIEQQWPGVRYLPTDLTPFFVARSPWVKERLARLMSELANGELPLLPVTAFHAREVKQAFRYMAGARHIGRVVVRTGDKSLAGGVHLVTGGLRGIGLKLAEWLVTQGARDLILVGRQAPPPEAHESLARLAQQGAAVRIFQGDIADPATAERLIAAVGNRLRGVWHCAGVLDNAPLAEQSWERIAPVMRPKVDGAWNLHVLTRASNLEFFVLYSSWASSLAGSRTQANYCSANAFLDGLANLRMAHGLPALSVNWGPWQETGAAVAESYQRQLTRAGVDPMKPEDAFAALKLALNTEEPQLAIAAMQWPKYVAYLAGSAATGSRPNPFYSEVAGSSGGRGNSVREPGGALARTEVAKPKTTLIDLRALPEGARRTALLRVVEELARKTLDLAPSEQIDPEKPLSELGMDSLLAIELRNGLSSFFAVRFASSLTFDYPTLKGLARFIDQEVFSPAPAEQVHATTEVTEVAAPGSAKPLSILDEIERLSDEEVDALFEKGSRR